MLNKCVTQEQEISITGEGSMDGPTVAADRPVHYNFDFLEDKDHGSDILLSMVGNQNNYDMWNLYMWVVQVKFNLYVT